MSTSIIGTRSQPATRQFRDNYDKIWSASKGETTGQPSDYTTMDSAQLLDACGSDARKWAAAFMQYFKASPGLATDEGAMTGWFANAMMRALDEDRWRHERAERTVATEV